MAHEAMAPMDAVFSYGEGLTTYEREEIFNFSNIYYTGNEACKIDAIPGAPNNCGYDDENGRYRSRIGDHIAYRFKLVSHLGKGAFGDCFKAYDFQENKWVALKIIRNEPRFHRQGKIECSVLKTLRQNDADDSHNVVHMHMYFTFRNHLCITFEMLGRDLYSETKALRFTGFSTCKTQQIARDVLKSLELLFELNIVHADLKPENILVADSGIDFASPVMDTLGERVVKVIDFGSSCYSHGKIHTYIQSRYYRAPEIMLGLGYGPGIDMWSLGCILVELDCGSPLFPAKNERDLMLYQLALLGLPSEELLAKAMRAHDFFSGTVPLMSKDKKDRVHPVGSKSLSDVCKNQDPLFLDFIDRCLRWNPAERMTPQQALTHPWLQQTAVPTMMMSPSSAASTTSCPRAPQKKHHLNTTPVGSGVGVKRSHTKWFKKTFIKTNPPTITEKNLLNDSGYTDDEPQGHQQQQHDQQVPQGISTTSVPQEAQKRHGWPLFHHVPQIC